MPGSITRYNHKNNEIKKKVEYNTIRSLIEKGKIDLAKLALKEYLGKYPNNSFAIKEYASIIRQEQGIEEALVLLSQADQDAVYIKREKAMCYIYQERYEKALEELNKIRDGHPGSENLKRFCRAKLQQATPSDLDFYTIQQTVHYNEKKALHRIKKKRISTDGKTICFNPDVIIDDIFHNIQNILPDAKPTIVPDNLSTVYIFQINSIGFIGQMQLNHLKVCTIPNSMDILTMYPYQPHNKSAVNNYEEMLISEDEKMPVKVKKRESQIEKFNRRYGKI